ncbi:MAG: Mpo1-like protein [Myxococcota bacterium]
MAGPRYASFWEFFPFYLSEHADSTNRILHFMGTGLVIAIGVTALVTLNPWFILGMPVAGYGFAWVGHFIVEKNRPATFTYPVWSLVGDFVMFGLAITGQLSKHMPEGPVAPPASTSQR